MQQKDSSNHIRDTFFKWTVAIVALLGGFLTAGCDRGQQSPQPPPVPEVTTVTIQPQRVVMTTELPGRTSAFRIAEIRPQVNGLVQKRLFTEGSDVKAGQVLYRIDPAPFQAALDNAKAALGRSEASLTAIRLRAERYREALADKAVSQQDYDDADAALKLESDDEDGQYQPEIHPCHRSHFRPHRQIQRDRWGSGDGVSACGPGNHSTTGSYLR